MRPGTHPLAGGIPEPWAVEWGEDRCGLFASFAVGGAVQRMRWVPSGRFRMGSPEDEAGRYEDEGPKHEVVLTRGFWLGETPVTQALWEAVMGSNPSRFVGADRPVEQVSWEDCQQFIGRLDELVPRLGARLPSEAEWEHACRAGTETATWFGDLEIRGMYDAPLLDAIAWYGGNSRKRSWPVRSKQANPLGLYDMLGNVYEWCQDWYGTYNAATAIDPTGPATGSDRVFRGGSWASHARNVRAADRFAFLPEGRDAFLGFRLARGQGPGPAGPGAEPLAAGGRSRRP